jgi:hypothetical protein
MGHSLVFRFHARAGFPMSDLKKKDICFRRVSGFAHLGDCGGGGSLGLWIERAVIRMVFDVAQ